MADFLVSLPSNLILMKKLGSENCLQPDNIHSVMALSFFLRQFSNKHTYLWIGKILRQFQSLALFGPFSRELCWKVFNCDFLWHCRYCTVSLIYSIILPHVKTFKPWLIPTSRRDCCAINANWIILRFWVLTTYPSPKPTLTLTSHLRQNVI